jgi:putative PIN family toxin of toxin-antitoxin system
VSSTALPADVVIDTNVVLDLLVFEDPASVPLRESLAQGRLRWLATDAMRDELQRVLGYPQIARRLAQRALDGDQVLARFDACSCRVPAGDRAPMRCADADDQIFVDLAWSHRAGLLSRDRLVLRLRKRLAAFGVVVGPPPART